MQTWLGIVLGIIIGVGLIYLPQLIRQITVSNLAVQSTRVEKQDLAAAKAEDIEEVAIPAEKAPFLVAIVGLGVGVAFATYLLARGRE